MSLYGHYIKEREAFEMVYSYKSKQDSNPTGFATYKITGNECYIRDIYVDPLFRQSGAAKQMADQIADIAKHEGCMYLIGSVSPSAYNSHDSMIVLLHYGFKLLRCEFNLIYFVKEL